MKTKTPNDKDQTELFLRRMLRSSVYNQKSGDTVTVLRKIENVSAVLQTSAQYIQQLDNLLVNDTLNYFMFMLDVCGENKDIDCKELLLTDLKQAVKRNPKCLSHSDLKVISSIYDVDIEFLSEFITDVHQERELTDYFTTLQQIQEKAK